MFRSLYPERKYSINGVILITIVLLCTTTALIFLHNNTTGEANDNQPQTADSLVIPTISLKNVPTSHEDSLTNDRVKRLPQAIIIGARKSGTRALLKFLEANPAVRAANKEIHFFDKPQNYKRGLNWYREQMPISGLSEVTIEKSPAYFVTPGVPERVKAMNSSVKLVLILRDPVTRLISDYSQLVANKIEAIEDDEDSGGGDYGSTILADGNLEYSGGHVSNSAWIEAEKNFDKYVRRLDGGINDQRRAIKVGMYSMYLERWRSIFAISQFHFVDGENLIKNPYDELHKLELFLNLEPSIRPENFVFNTRKGFYCLAINHSDSDSDQNELMDPHGQVKRSNASTSTPNCLSKSKGRRHVAVSKELIEELRKFYAPYNEYLFSMMDKNFNWQ